MQIRIYLDPKKKKKKKISDLQHCKIVTLEEETSQCRYRKIRTTALRNRKNRPIPAGDTNIPLRLDVFDPAEAKSKTRPATRLNFFSSLVADSLNPARKKGLSGTVSQDFLIHFLFWKLNKNGTFGETLMIFKFCCKSYV